MFFGTFKSQFLRGVKGNYNKILEILLRIFRYQRQIHETHFVSPKHKNYLVLKFMTDTVRK